MRLIDSILFCSILWPNLKEVEGKTFCSNILSTAHSGIVGAVDRIQTPYDGVSDQDNILSQSAKEKLAAKIHHYSSSLAINREGRIAVKSTTNDKLDDETVNKNADVNTANDEFPVQIAVAIVEEIEVMNHDGFRDNSAEIEELAGQFAISLHNAWGIGHEILPRDKDDGTNIERSGGTGVLVFLSVRDRVVFISVGGALEHLLTSGRIERIINDNMKTDFKRANYGLGLMNGIDELVEILKKNEEPSMLEKLSENTSLIIAFLYAAFFGLGVLQKRKERREQRIYAKVAAQLSELDRARAEALRGSYERTTSCPICFEEFSSEELGSDGRPLQLLRCGHIFDKTCYEEWILSGHGDVTKCPVCRADVGPCCDGHTTRSTMTNRTSENNLESERDNDTNDQNGGNDDDHQIIDGSQDGDNSSFDDNTAIENEITTESRSDNTGRIMIQYRVDRNFRLERLSQLYPRYITPDTLTRWRSPTFNGSLVSDRTFTDRNPEVTENASRCSSSATNRDSDFGGGYSFGGGSSAGGTGGRF